MNNSTPLFDVGLSHQERERLAILLEELGEAQQVIGKILRHGYESSDPTKPDSPTNRKELEKELGDVGSAIWLMTHNGDLSCRSIDDRMVQKLIVIRRYLHFWHGIPVKFGPESDG